MKRYNVTLFEVSRQEVLEMDSLVQILIYNPFTGNYSLDFADKNCIARNRNAAPELRYFLFNIGEMPRS